MHSKFSPGAITENTVRPNRALLFCETKLQQQRPVMECKLAEVVENDSFYCIVGKIVNTAAEEKVLSENGKVDPAKLQALIFDQFQHGYYVSGEQVGKAWNSGAGLMKK